MLDDLKGISIPEGVIVRKSFAIPFAGTMLWCEELDALGAHRELVQDKFLRDMAQVNKPSTPALVVMNLHSTSVDRPLASLFARELAAAVPHVRKVAFAGVNIKTRKLLTAALEAAGPGFAYSFFLDFERAKEWLAGK